MKNRLAELAKTGQSIWFDQMERKLVSSGKLQKMIDEDDLRGLTSNPTIFEKAIGGSEDYDAQLRHLASEGKSSDEIYDELVLEDIASAADVFRPVYDRTNGADGFVSIEVSPLIAHDTSETIDEAKRLDRHRYGQPSWPRRDPHPGPDRRPSPDARHAEHRRWLARRRHQLHPLGPDPAR